MSLISAPGSADPERPMWRDGARRASAATSTDDDEVELSETFGSTRVGGSESTKHREYFTLDAKTSHTLYDRERESRKLVGSFERCMAKTTWELLLVTGASGTGKTSLVEAALKPLVLCQGGCFVSGKFDLLERSEQYYTFVQALSEFARIVKARPSRFIEVQAVLAPLKETICLLVDMIPPLNDLLVPETGTKGGSRRSSRSPLQLEAHQSAALESSHGPSPSSRQRLTLALCQFLEAVCAPECPLVLFLDDLQWAEPASLDLLAALAGSRIPGLVLIGACRDNEVSACAHLSVILRELEANHMIISQVIVDNLGLSSLTVMAADVFGLDEMKASMLARIVLRFTFGNMFSVGQFLRILVEEDLLYQDVRGKWAFESEEKIRVLLGSCDDMTSLLSLNLEKQEKTVQDILMVASCLGSEFSELLLRKAVAFDVDEPLQVAEAKGFFMKSTIAQNWRFVHDQIQQGAYNMIPTHEREEVHLQIGRKLWKALDDEELSEYADVIVKQLRLGARLLTREREKEQMAWLLLRAVELASVSASYLTAQEYIGLGLSLLSSRHWRDQYDLSLSLYNAAAEIEYCLGNFTRMDEFLHDILVNARNPKDKLRAKTAQIYSLGSRNLLQEAIDTGLETLKSYFGESFPARPSTLGIILELNRTKRLLRRVSDAEILAKAPMVDMEGLASMRIMCIVFVYAVYGRPMLAPMIAMRLVHHSIYKGTSGMSGDGFSSMAMLLCNVFDDTDLGIRCARLSLQLMDKFDAREWLPRVYTAVYAFCLVYREKLTDQLQPLLLAHRVGLGGGDIEFSMLSACMYSTAAVFCSVRLSQLVMDVNAFLALMNVHQQSNMEQFLRPTLQFIQNLRGKCQDPSVLNGEDLNFAQAIREATETKNSSAISVICLYQMLLAGYFGKFEEVLQASKLRCRLGNDSLACFCKAAIWLHEGIATVEVRSRQCTRRKIGLARRNLKKLTKLSLGSRHNFASKASLLAAEIDVVDGNFHQSLVHYDSAIAQAKESQNWSDLGWACERAAMALQSKGRLDEARSYLDQAANAYETWGATAKAMGVRAKMLEPS